VSVTFGMPYMGNKQGIVASIAMNFPKSEHFYDLFGGGGSVTHYMMTQRANRHTFFHYNEINPLVADLLKRAISGEFNYERFKPEWISRERFFADKDKDGYVRCLWSFGNYQRTYLFSEEIEEYKKAMHQAVVFEDFNQLAIDTLGFNKWPKEANTIKKRRFYLRQKLSWYNENRMIPKCLYQFLSEKQLKEMGKKNNVNQLQQLQALEQLQQLERLERLTITSLSYEQVEIKPNSIVYCDIPYSGTADYGGSFCHKTFFEWAATRDFPVFISEYDVPDKRFKLVYTIDKRSMLSGESTNLIKQEKLYWNGRTL
jgi:site-specific DNA-adenine methylase